MLLDKWKRKQRRSSRCRKYSLIILREWKRNNTAFIVSRKCCFTEPCFKALSCEAKVLYGLMLDRMSLSIKNRWLDSEDRVYIIFTVEEIAELMNCGTQKGSETGKRAGQ